MLRDKLTDTAIYEERYGFDRYGQPLFKPKRELCCRELIKFSRTKLDENDVAVGQIRLLTYEAVALGDKVNGRIVVSCEERMSVLGEADGWEVVCG